MKNLKIDKRVYKTANFFKYTEEIQLYGVVAKLLANRGVMTKINEMGKENKEYSDKAFVWAVYNEMKLLDENENLTYDKFEKFAPLSHTILKIKNDILFSAMNIFQKIFTMAFKIDYKYPKYN